MVEVTQADREAASAVMLGGSDAMRSGRADNDMLVQAFARHRIAAFNAGLEAAAKVADDRLAPLADPHSSAAAVLRAIATAIRNLKIGEEQ